MGVRAWGWSVLIVSAVASADDRTLHLRLAEEPAEPLLHLDPQMFAEPQRLDDWHRELSYDLGPFRVAIAAATTHVGDTEQRTVGLFAYRTFHLSRWMRAWISLGLTFDQWEDASVPGVHQGMTAGLSIGTTFR